MIRNFVTNLRSGDKKFAQGFLLKKKGERPLYAQKGKVLTLNMSGGARQNEQICCQNQLAVQSKMDVSGANVGF